MDKKSDSNHSTRFHTALGWMKISADEDHITSVVFDDNDEMGLLEPETENPLLLKCREQLQEYFEGKRHDFDLPLAPKGTGFQQEVWQNLMRIPYGHTISYLTLAQTLGDINATRAVANANGRNPLAIIVPCHRVIGSNGSLTGYAGGLWRKKWLLGHEMGVQELFS